MPNVFLQSVANQFEAAFETLEMCVDRCPVAAWDAPVGNNPFCQVVFHTLIFADLYLGENAEALRGQVFHRENGDFFGSYEQFEQRRPMSLYERAPIRLYSNFCREKARRVTAAESAESLTAPASFEWLRFSRGELHIYNIRHIQHHAAQLSLRLRIDFEEHVPWVATRVSERPADADEKNE